MINITERVIFVLTIIVYASASEYINAGIEKQYYTDQTCSPTYDYESYDLEPQVQVFQVSPRITIRWPSLDNITVEVSPLYVHEKFEIRVYTDFKIDEEIRCLQFKGSFKICEDEENCYTANISKVEIKSTAWDCALLLDGIEHHTPQFNVELRSANPAVLYVHGQRRESQRDSTVDYDQFYNYSYVDGELVEFECKPFRGTTVEMRYHDKDNMKIEVPKNAKHLYLKLNKDRNPKYLDCVVADLYTTFAPNGGIMVYVYNTLRVFFKPCTLDYPTFKINDLVLRSKKRNESDTADDEIIYTYDFDNNEQIKLETVFDKKLYQTLECTAETAIVPEELSEYENTRRVEHLNLNLTLKKSFNNVSLSCNVIKGDAMIFRFSLEFRSRTTTIHIERLTLSGFSHSNVIFIYVYQYIHNMEYLTDTLRQIPYRGTEQILHCTFHDDGIKWLFNENEVETHSLLDLSYIKEIEGFKMSRSFKLKPNFNKTVISCDRKHYGKTMIELIRDEPLVTTDNTSAGAANDVTVIVLVIAGVVVLLALIITSIYYLVPILKIRHHKTDQQQNEPSAVSDQREATASEQIYEAIDYDAINSLRTAADIRMRPAHPLPPDAFEENQFHYDSPYDWRRPVRAGHVTSPSSK